MRSPIRSVPTAVARWHVRLRGLRGLDAVVAVASAWAVATAALGPGSGEAALGIATLTVGLGIALWPLRVRWRPISSLVTLAKSRRLRPGDRAWYVRARQADLVLVTARRGLRAVIAWPDPAGEESLTVRRTRVLLLPADQDGGGRRAG
jgi:hypothetical protein